MKVVKSKNLVPWLSLLAIMFAPGCGEDAKNNQPQNSPQAASPYIPGPNGTYFPPNTVGPNGNPAYTPQIQGDWQTIRGLYTGVLSKNGTEQNFQMTVFEETISNSTYGKARIQSQGAIGSLDQTVYLRLAGDPRTVYYSQIGQYRLEYVFYSTIANVPAISSSSISLSLTASLVKMSGGASLDPTRSLISIKDCGFSVGTTACSFPVTGVSVRLIEKK